MTLGIVPDPQRLVLRLQLDRDLGYPFPEPGVCVVMVVCAWWGGRRYLSGFDAGFLL